MSDRFTILRVEIGGYSTRGPVAASLSLRDAREAIVNLKKKFPHQDFVIMGEVGEVTKSERVAVKMSAPVIEPAKKPRTVKAGGNVAAFEPRRAV